MAIVNSNYAALTDYFHINLPDSSSRKSVLFAKEVGLKKMNLVKKSSVHFAKVLGKPGTAEL